MTVKLLKKWLAIKSLPLIIPFEHRYQRVMFARDTEVPLHLVFIASPKYFDEHTELKEVLEKVGPNPRFLTQVDRQRLRDASFRHSSQPGQHGNARLLRRFRRQRSDDLPRMLPRLFSPCRSKTATRITNSPSTASSPTPPSAISSLGTTETSCLSTSNPKSLTTNAMATSACWSAPTSRRWLSTPT